MKTLLLMTDFVLEQRNSHRGDVEDFADLVCRYALFLKQHFEKWMVVPCDEEGNVLEKPEFKDTLNSDAHFLATEKYQQAKERRLFEGFENYTNRKNTVVLDNLIFKLENYKTIEDLVKHNLQLTPTAIEQIGL